MEENKRDKEVFLEIEQHGASSRRWWSRRKNIKTVKKTV